MYATLTIEAIDYQQEILFTPEERYAELTLWAQQVSLSVEDNVSTVVAEFFLTNYVKGVGIANIEKTETVGLVDTYTITYTDGTTTTFDVTNGIEGGDGRGIVSIIKTSTQELTDTYTITYTDDTTSTFDVTNGVDGVSVESITLYDTVGLVDTYEIVYSTGSRSYFDVTNGQNGIDGVDGVGIVSVALLSTVGKVKTYRITFTNNTTFDYDVTDGNDGTNGTNGISPTIGLNGNWYIGATDTGVKAAGTDGTDGLDGTDGVGISNITKTGTVLNVDEYTITFTDSSTFKFYVTNGIDGEDGTNGTNGRGIVSILKTSTVGVVDTYTITYSDTTTSTFDVTNGAKGDNGTSAYQIYVAGGGTLSEVDYNASITEIPAHIADATKHIDTTVDGFTGILDETNDKLTIWDNSLLKWIRFSFTSLKTYLSSHFLKLDQTTPQTLTQSPIITDLVATKLMYVDANNQIKTINAFYDPVKEQLQIGAVTGYNNTYGLAVGKKIISASTIEFSAGNGALNDTTLTVIKSVPFTIKNINTGANSAIEIWTKNVLCATFTPSQGLDVVGNITALNLSGTNTGDNATNTRYSGLATSKQDALGFTPENVTNKKTTLTDSDTDYPTCKAVNTVIAGISAGNIEFSVTRIENTTGSETLYNTAQRKFYLLDITNAASTYTVTISRKPASGGTAAFTNVEHYVLIRNTAAAAKTLVVQLETTGDKMDSEGLSAVAIPANGIYELGYIWVARGNDNLCVITKSTLLSEITK